MSLALASVEPQHPTYLCKEALDRITAVALLLFLAPLLLVLAAAVATTSSGPVFFRRRVVGRHGIEFDAFKFRTMVVDADAILHAQPELHSQFAANMKLRDDPRLTRIGAFLRRTSLDELPQLINVAAGSMSLVGPRMIAPDETTKFGELLPQRLAVKPGITGLWQVSGRQELAYDDRIRLDLHYIDNWSLWLDLEILARTIPAVLSMRGAY
jgi:lipopolysaccharide/colanic/teichoic acid biosynthesis glycosyltransferase